MFCIFLCSEQVHDKFKNVLRRIRFSTGCFYEVTPTGRHIRGFDEQSWKATDEFHDSPIKDRPEEFSRNSEERKSKTKRVKNYLKRCKNALAGTPKLTQENPEQNCSYWYIDEVKREEIRNKNEESCISNDEKCLNEYTYSECQNEAIYEEISDIQPSETVLQEVEECAEAEEERLEEEEEENIEDYVSDAEIVFGEGRAGDVASLIDRVMGPLYLNYKHTRPVLVRQARDLLVCEYLGNFARFETEFCLPAAKLLEKIVQQIKENDTSTIFPNGWPLSLGPSGIILHLGPLAPALLRNRDCYLCVRGRSAPGLEVALVWRRGGQISCRTLAHFTNPLDKEDGQITCNMGSMSDIEVSSFEDIENEELPELLSNLLVSVEHAIERVPLDDLAFPCPQCNQYLPVNERGKEESCACRCSCVLPELMVAKKDTCIQTSPMFEFAGAIPHIDSDEDDETFRSIGSTKRVQEVIMPKKIADVPEKLLMSGINLPGTYDTSGRPVILCDAPCVARAGLNKYEVATLLLYYASIPCKERIERGFTILVLAETAEDITLDVIDKAILLILSHVKISNVLVWRPGRPSGKNLVLNTSRIKVHVISDEQQLECVLTKEQAPACCGGECTHDQLEWVEFFKEAEPFIEQCQTIARALLRALQNVRDEEIPIPVARRFLHHQQRQLNRALQEPGLQSLRRSGSGTLSNLTERAQWLPASEDVRRRTMYAKHTFQTADKIARRLEELETIRRTRLEELNRLRAFEDEAKKLLGWLREKGARSIKEHDKAQRNLTSSNEIKEQEHEFEKFYFDAMREIDKVGDLLESSNNCQSSRALNFKETAQVLKQEMKIFQERLEELRERLEDTSRCFDLLSRSQTFNEDAKSDVSEILRLAEKSANQKLLEKCQELRNTDTSTPTKPVELTTSTPIRPSAGRRRSVSSLAFIYKCNHHAAGVPCDCWESESENTESAKLKKKYVQSLQQNCGCKLDRQNSLGLDNIKEVRESVEDLKIQQETKGETTCDYKCKDSDCDNLKAYKNTKPCDCKTPCDCSIERIKIPVERQNSFGLNNIKEVRESIEDLVENQSNHNDSGVSGCGRCDSGLSTGNGSSVCQSAIDDSGLYKKRLQRTCSCQFYGENVACSGESSSGGSHGDHTDHQQDSLIEEGDGFPKSNGSDELEETEEQYNNERNKSIPPIPVNSHLHCHASSLDLPNIHDQNIDPKIQKTLLLIMREMIQTERDYVKSLFYVIENYIPELLREDIPQALRGQRNVVFGNIEKIYEFHSQQFLRELELCEDSPLHVGQIFLRHTNKFSLYALYNKNKPKSDSLMSEYGRSFFKSKQLELNDNLDLASYLLKPVQRMGKYALLLQQLMKACPPLPEGASDRVVAEREDLNAAEDMVRFQLRHGNDLLAMDSIRDCDVNLKEQGRLLRQNEFLVSEGRGAKKSLRQVFLFEELILFSKARRFPDRKNLDLYIYKNSIKMTDIGLTAKIGDSPTKFEIWFRKRKPNDTFVLQSMSEEVKKAWTEELSKLLWKQAMKNREIRLQEMSSMGIGNKPCLDIRPSADQINDRSISIAQLSKTAPRFRNSIVGPVSELCRSNRPQSIISVSSISSGSTSSQGSSGNLARHLNATGHLGFDPVDSPHSHRSRTLNSQCSTESGIIADISIGSDDCQESQNSCMWSLQKSSSTTKCISNSSQTEETQITLFHVPDDIPVNI